MSVDPRRALPECGQKVAEEAVARPPIAPMSPGEVKRDMGWVRRIDRHGPRQAIVRAVVQACDDLAIDVVVEGVETVEECAWFLDHGVRLFQGYLFARPLFQGLPPWQGPEGTMAR